MSLGEIRVREAAIGYKRTTVLRNVDLTIVPGERVVVLGRSGAGKTTLLNTVYAGCAPDAALIPQSTALVQSLSVFHNVFMGRLDRHPTWYNVRTLAWPPRREVDAVRSILEVVGLPEEIFVKAGQLSGGQQQRTSMARALFNARPIVIGDEPVSALDRHQAAALLGRLAERHPTQVLALHDVPLALAHASRILVIEGGRIALDAPASSLAPSDLDPFYLR